MGELIKKLLRSGLGAQLVRLAERTPLRRRVLSAVYDPRTGAMVGSGDSEADWDERARRNSRFFIAVDDAESEERFLESGVKHLKELILKGIPLEADWSVLEIGCGTGRLMRPLSPLVREVHGVDVSGEMVRLGADALKDLPNVHVHHTAGDLRMIADASCDFCYSYRVFQHIPSKDAVIRYIRETARVLKPAGWFRFQVCLGEARSRRLQEGGTWFGVLFSEAELQQIVPACGFDLLSVEGTPSPAREALWDYVVVTCRRA
jgi:SAM-dependent methyltransferase